MSNSSGQFVVLWAMLFLAGNAQAKEREFSPVAQAGQEVRFSDGTAVLLTGNVYGNLAVSFVPVDKKSGLLRIWAENASEQQFNISEASVTGTSAAGPIVVMSYADQVKAQKRKEKWAAFGTALVAGLNSYNASQAGYSSYSGGYNSHTSASVYGSGGYASGSANTSGRFYGTSYSAGVAYLAQADALRQNQAMFDRFQYMSAAAARDLRERSLKANTLMPGQSVIGDVKIMLPVAQKTGATEFQLAIEIGGAPLNLVFREGPPVVDRTPQVASLMPAPGSSPAAALRPAPSPALYREQVPSQSYDQPQLNSGAAMAKAYAHPSGPAARNEFVKLGCSDGFALVSAAAGRAIFESTCAANGKKQLLECHGSGCAPLN